MIGEGFVFRLPKYHSIIATSRVSPSTAWKSEVRRCQQREQRSPGRQWTIIGESKRSPGEVWAVTYNLPHDGIEVA